MNFKEKLQALFRGKPDIDENLFEDLLDLLVEGDFEAASAVKIVDSLKERAGREHISDYDNLRNALEAELLAILSPLHAQTISLIPGAISAVLLLGVNGVGKTTSAAKIASLFSSQGKSAILAACDTFRAAAIDQLKIHGERLGIRVVAHKPGGDAAAVFYDALFAAKSAPADGGILVVADTAGRMHTKSALLEELKKIDRVTEKFQGQEGGVRVNTLRYLVLDATTGGNALSQAEVFGGAVPLDGVILTKYDSTAKGGVVFSLASREKLPVAYLCSGEHYPDIAEFDAARFVKEFCNG